MAKQVIIQYSPESLRTLDAIWLWNAEQHGGEHADQYIEFLRSETRRLLTSPVAALFVPTRPALKYFILKKRKRGHGHVVVFREVSGVFQLIDFFHTAQDWQNQLPAR